MRGVATLGCASRPVIVDDVVGRRMALEAAVRRAHMVCDLCIGPEGPAADIAVRSPRSASRSLVMWGSYPHGRIPTLVRDQAARWRWTAVGLVQGRPLDAPTLEAVDRGSVHVTC